MKKKSFLFIAFCLVLCLIPSIGMLFFPTTESTENKAMSEVPKLIENGKINKLFFQDCGEYFNDHIALRNEMIFVDAKIQTKLFSESNVSGVIYGENDWLYYSSTLDDYLGRNQMSERELYNLSHNISIIQDYLDKLNIDFIFTIPPNKNTLYDENMPYHSTDKVNAEHNAKRLEAYLEEANIKYLDLFDLFENQDETLYLLRDSHWNMKGACLAYNNIMDSLKIKHNDYSETPPVIEKKTEGDLNKMLYSIYGEPEENYNYNLPMNYSYKNKVNGVEDGWIITENQMGKGTLLMFRDSFADTLIPFISNEFRTAYYSKGLPNALERYIEDDKPDCVVMEKVERNITDYLNTPPIITPATTELPDNITIATTDSTVTIEECLYDAEYYVISGILDSERVEDNSDIVVCVNDKLYKAYHIEEYGYILYLKKSEFENKSISLDVYSVNDDNCIRLLSSIIDSIN